MRDITLSPFQVLLVAAIIVVVGMLGVSHGQANAIEEYEQGFKDGWKDALYGRPVAEELEMVCLGLWTATLPEQK